MLGRAIVATEIGDPGSRLKVLVIGAIHGNETAGIAVARHLAEGIAPRNADLWIVNNLNPDGAAQGTRQNARAVDLNRNFPFRWEPIEALGSVHYSGPGPLSEPEARAAKALIDRLRPTITIWYHQPLGLVDLSGGSPLLVRRYAHLAGVRVRRLARYPGSASRWQNHRFPGTTAFVVELPAGTLSPAVVERHSRAVRALANSLAHLRRPRRASWQGSGSTSVWSYGASGVSGSSERRRQG